MATKKTAFSLTTEAHRILVETAEKTGENHTQVINRLLIQHEVMVGVLEVLKEQGERITILEGKVME